MPKVYREAYSWRCDALGVAPYVTPYWMDAIAYAISLRRCKSVDI